MGENVELYAIGEHFRLDAQQRLLFAEDNQLPLKPKAIDTLIYLTRNAGRVVEKKELLDAVWPDTFVDENNLSVNIYELRRAFQSVDPTGKFVETIPRRGFRFVAPVSRIAVERSLEVKTPLRRRENQRYALMAIAVACAVLISTGAFFAWNSSSRSRSESGRSKAVPLEAQQFYLRGRELWQTRDNRKMEKGIEFFRRAIEIEPNYAAPYAGIADSLSMMRNDAEDWRQAEEYARKAVALDPASGDARASLAFILAMDKWQWNAAESEFQEALKIDPSSGKAHQWYATVLEIERRFPEAEEQLKRAVEIEPLSPNYNADLCELYYFSGRYDDAFTQCKKAHEINPDFAYDSALRNIYIVQRRYDEAAQEYIDSQVRLGSTVEAVKSSAWYVAYKKGGFRAWIASDLERQSDRGDVLLDYSDRSIGYAMLEDRERTLEMLEKSYAGHAFLLPFVNANPQFDFIRDDPRFRELMKRVGVNSAQ